MKPNMLYSFLSLCVAGVVFPGGFVCGEGGPGKVRVIFDTDMSVDCADAGALAVLHALADAGEAEIAGVVLSGRDRAGASAATVDAINSYHGRADVPIGVGRARYVATESAFTAAVRDGFPHDQPGDGEVSTGAVELYRKLLSGAGDGGVSIVSAGFLTNLRGLLESEADGISKLDGKALVAAKVKRLTVVGGEFPGGSEFSFRGGVDGGHAGDAAAVMGNWPDGVEVVFVGFEVGKDVRTGTQLAGTPPGNPVKKIYGVAFESLKLGRPSWDAMAVLFAVRGADDYWGAVDKGSVRIGEDGGNAWAVEPDGNQKYLVGKMPERELEFVLGELMSRPPGSGGEALVGHWAMDGSADDAAGGNGGKVQGGAAFAAAGEGGKRALMLDGADDFVEIPAVPELALPGYSIGVWVKVAEVDGRGWRTVFEHGREVDNWYGLWQNEIGERFHFRWGPSDTADFSGAIKKGDWQHVVATVDPGRREVRLYLDGVLDKKLENIRVPVPSAQVMKIGCNVEGKEFFAGMVGELRVYRRPLSDDEVRELAKKGL